MTFDPAPGLIVPQMIVIKRASWCENNVKLRKKNVPFIAFSTVFLSPAVLIAPALRRLNP